MSLPRTITDAIKKGYSSDFTSLLEEFGKWSRYFGCQGYGSGSSGECYNIDDESAALLDKVFCKLKAEHPGMYQLMACFYIKRMSEMQILYEIKHAHVLKGKNLRYVTTAMIRDQLKEGDLYILRELKYEVDCV